MKTNAYSIYDAKAGLYNKPFYFHNHAMAIRATTEAARDRSTTLGQHPEDYTLFHTGIYDEETGVFTQKGTHEPVARLHELVTLDENS